jgi:hypothetical protein
LGIKPEGVAFQVWKVEGRCDLQLDFHAPECAEAEYELAQSIVLDSTEHEYVLSLLSRKYAPSADSDYRPARIDTQHGFYAASELAWSIFFRPTEYGYVFSPVPREGIDVS